MRKIGLAALTCLELVPPALVSAAAAAGYDCVGLRLIPVPGQVLPPYDARELERRLADTGLRVLDIEVFRVDEHVRLDAFEPVMALAQRLGATDLLAHGVDAEEARLVHNFGALCELAERYGLAVNIEPMPWVNVATIAHARKIVSVLQKENAAVLVDPIHFFRADNKLEELGGIPPNQLRYLQFCDARAERPADMQELIRQARGDRLFPGEGGLDLKGLLAALPAGLPMTLEMPILRKLDPYERARLALEATRQFLLY